MFFPLDIVWRWGIKLAFHEILLACLVDAGRARVRPANRLAEVRPDGRVTFRLKASGAKEVQLRCEGVRNSAMQKDDQGVWSFTTDPLEPDIYAYSFNVDGLRVIAPSTFLIRST